MAPDSGGVSRRRQIFGSSLKPSAPRGPGARAPGLLAVGAPDKKALGGCPSQGRGAMQTGAPPPAGLSPAPGPNSVVPHPCLVPIRGWQPARKQLRAETAWGASWPGCGPLSGVRIGDSSYYQEAVKAGAGGCGTQGSTEPAARGGLIPQPCKLPRSHGLRTPQLSQQGCSQAPHGLTTWPAPHCPSKGAVARPLGCGRPLRGGVPSSLPSDASSDGSRA